ncbi:MAG: hypothetical protein AB7H90_01110 [Alphaproteobacteria bacterium]
MSEGTFWTPERFAELAIRIKAGETFASIAKAWGVTKNTVVGKAYRSGLRHPNGQRRKTTFESRLDQINTIPEHGRCRYVSEGMTSRYAFCGAPVLNPGGSYCPDHRSVVYIPPARQAAAEKAIEKSTAYFARRA